jgi:hypothetical protein
MQVKYIMVELAVSIIASLSFFALLVFCGTIGCESGTKEPVNPYPDGYSLTHMFYNEGYGFQEWCIYDVKYLVRYEFVVRLSDTNGNPIPCEVEKQ